MPERITQRLLDRLAVENGRAMVFDSELPGFGVRATPSGKVFFVQYRAGSGRMAPKRRLSIGRYGALTVDQARQLAREALADVTRGGDPAAGRQIERRAPTIASLGEDYLADVRDRRKESTAREYARLWKQHIEPTLGTRRVADVATADVARVHRSMRKTPYAANRVLALLGSFFGYAERHGARMRHTNPAHDIEPYKEESRERFLTQIEVSRLGEALVRAERDGLSAAPNRKRKNANPRTAKHRPKTADRPIPANPYAVAAIRFLLLTGWREREALNLRWSEVDETRGMVRLADTKTGKSVRMIGAPARLLLSGLPRLEDSPYVFPGRIPEKPLVEINRVWYAVRHEARLDDVRLHDLRHSFASVSASSGGSLLVIGKLLGHKETSTTAKYAHLLDDPVRIAADAASSQLAEWLATKPVEPEAAKGRPRIARG